MRLWQLTLLMFVFGCLVLVGAVFLSHPSVRSRAPAWDECSGVSNMQAVRDVCAEFR